jgi:hypothetical protein
MSEQSGEYKTTMKYNCSIQNDSPIPLPYSISQGENIKVGSLRKTQPMFIQLNYITGSNDGQCFRFNCQINGEPAILVLPVDSELNIKFVEDEKPTASA